MYRNFAPPVPSNQAMSARRPLELLQIPAPCPANWDAMSGDAAGRFCQHCQKTVHDLSAMTRDEAERLVCQAAGVLCVRITRLPDGQVQTLDYQTTTAKPYVSSRVRRFFGFAGALVCGLVAVAVYGGRLVPPTTRLMGAIAPPRSSTSGPYAPNFVPPCSTGASGDVFDLSSNPSAEGLPLSVNQ